MGLGSVILGIFAFLLMIAGVIFVWVPFLGTMLAFLSPILAIAGVVLGGVAMSRAKQGMGESEGLATAGLVLNIIAFVPAMLVALTCGLCNTMCTSAFVSPPDPAHTSPVPWDRDGGVNDPLQDLFEPPDAAVPELVAPPSTAPSTPMQRQGDETPLPPPPLPPGPTGAAPSTPPAVAPSAPPSTAPSAPPGAAPSTPPSAAPSTSTAPSTAPEAAEAPAEPRSPRRR
ncbi:MAG: DUF4190 domain-containing protein, partial [Sandaracinaceae bacterium]|nr:DUF4190 domain-containing protein [Sandaracinaceae bacterium]